jgi:hypothetical protein
MEHQPGEGRRLDRGLEERYDKFLYCITQGRTVLVKAGKNMRAPMLGMATLFINRDSH